MHSVLPNNDSEQSDGQGWHLVDRASVCALIHLDAEGRVVRWSPGAARLFGYAASEVLGKPCEFYFTPQDQAAESAAKERANAAADGTGWEARWHPRKDGTVFWAECVLIAQRGADTEVQGFIQVVRDATAYKQAELDFEDRARLLALTADVTSALTTQNTSSGMLRGCAEAFVRHLDAAFARIWTLNEVDKVLELQASAGQYTHLNGPHGRVPVGMFKIGLIAQERKPHLTNTVVGDPRVGDQEWAKREGMVAFAGYPLIVDERLVGVVAMFARHPLSDVTIQTIGSVADEIAVGIERKRAEEALRASEERYRAAFAHAAVGATLADLEGCYLTVNPAFCAITGYSEEELLSKSFASITHPEDLAADRAQMARLQAGELPNFVIEKRYLRKDGVPVWVQNSVALVRGADGRPLHTVALTQDVSERKAAEKALRESEARFRQMADAIPHIAWTTAPDGSVDYYNQRWYDYSGLTFEQTRDWGWEPVIHPEDIARAGGIWRAAIEAGMVSEVEYRLRKKDGEYRWHLGRSEPVRDDAGAIVKWVGTATDIEARKQAEAEREWLLAQAEARAEREALLNRIGEAIRGTPDPDLIQTVAVRVLGEALGADRAYFTVYDLERDRARVGEDYRRADLASLAGEQRISDYQIDPVSYYPDGAALIMTDVLSREWPDPVLAALTALRVRSVISVPLFDNGALVGTLAVAMADEPRVWTDDEISLVDAVAVRARAALESARAQQREHRIATELQDALQPRVPEHVPGLRLAPYTKPALAESEVGGDFFDVFALDKDLYALVLGDVSGKGLAAAAQLALVRNSLRTTLYLYRDPAEAATNLNTILTTHDLLAGFVTAFVGIYEAATGRISYASCGHEPGLIRRAATGTVESLVTTGPPLGVAENTIYGEQSVFLSSDDALLLYTDGLSEAGPSRREMLGTEGMIRLLAAQSIGGDVRSAAASLVNDVYAYANRVFRDDVCVLLIQRR